MAMAPAEISGPIRVLRSPGGMETALYVIPYDKRGVCTGPATRDRLVEQVDSATDVFVFSHGWNSDWKAAIGAYDRFVEAYVALRAQEWPNPDRDYKPLLAGVFWPSAALVAPWEQAPDIAGVVPLADGVDPDLVELASGMSDEMAGRFYALADRVALRAPNALMFGVVASR